MKNQRLKITGIGGTLREGSTSLAALRRSLAAAGEAGAETELLDLQRIRLPFYEPGKDLDDYGPEVAGFVEAVRGADALLLSTGAYHGTLAGVTKNALDFLQFLSGGERPYLDGKVVGVISTAGGDQAAVRAADALVDAAHALRATVVPLVVAIPKAWRSFDEGEITDETYAARLDSLGQLVVEAAGRFAVHPTPDAESRPVGNAA